MSRATAFHDPSMMVFGNRGSHPFASFVVQASGVGYFLLWSYSFWPQFIMNFKRRR